MFGVKGLNMRLAALYLLECTACKVYALRWVVVLQMSSVIFVITYLKIREKHLTANKATQAATYSEKPTSATQ